METVSYIRHFSEQERQSSDTPDIFRPKPAAGDSYQDVISFSNFERDKYLVYTVGKHVFPQNHTATISMQRWMIIFVAGGMLKCGTQELVKGDFIMLPSSCSTVFESKKEMAQFYWITTNDELHINTLLSCGYSDKKLMFGHMDYIQSVTELFEDTLYHFPTGCDARIWLQGRISCLYSYIAPSVVKKHSLSDQLFKRCLNRIESSQGNITVDFLAKHYFVSRRYLYTLFKEYKNMSPIEYILAVRMQAADKYLLNTNYSIAVIAELTGYSNYSHFTRAYTKYFSMSPSDRRKQAMAQAIKSDEAAEAAKPMLLDE